MTHDQLPLASERHQAVAGTWAELFCKDCPDNKPLFIEHYLKRTLARRFWARTSYIEGEKIAVCRLGDSVFLALHRGQIRKLSVRNETVLGLKIPKALVGPTRQVAHFLAGLQRKLSSLPTDAAINFDSLTSFSKHAHTEVGDALQADIPAELKIYPGPKHNRFAGFYRVRHKKYIGQYGHALKEFLAETDQTILFAIRSVRCPSIALYNWLAASSTERRLQALKAYPIMVPIEILVLTKAGELGENRLSQLIDSGASLVPHLAEVYCTRPSVVKKLGRLSPYQVGSSLSFLKHEFDRNQFSKAIAAYELGNKRPQSHKGWKRCMMAMQSSARMAFTESSLAGLPAWESEEWESLLPAIRNIYDLGNLGSIVSSKSIKKGLSLSHEWHEKRRQVQRDVLEEQAANQPVKKVFCWPGMLIGEVSDPATGLIFVEILDDLSLAEEGDAMGHCVGGYAGRCFEAYSRIISIRSGQKSLATLEYTPEISASGKKSYRCVQAQGPGNKPYSKEVGAALTWFSRNIRKFIRTYDLERVPVSQRPPAYRSLSSITSERMRDWMKTRLIQLGYGEEMKAHLENERRYRYADYDD